MLSSAGPRSTRQDEGMRDISGPPSTLSAATSGVSIMNTLGPVMWALR
jgi:hypothetical protein